MSRGCFVALHRVTGEMFSFVIKAPASNAWTCASDFRSTVLAKRCMAPDLQSMFTAQKVTIQ